MSGRNQNSVKVNPLPNIRGQYIEMASLRWSLVERTRQNWTCLSLSVVAACAWLLIRSHSGIQGTHLAWGAGAISVLFAMAWVLGKHAQVRTQKRLNGLEDSTGCRGRYPMLRLISD